MRPVPTLLVLAALVVAGCVSTPGTSPTPSPEGDAIRFVPDCTLSVVNATWKEPCVALASPNPSPSKTEIDVAVNPKDPNNVIVGSKDLDLAASTCVWAVPQVTHDGGKTWKSVYIGGKLADRVPGEPLFGWGCITDPIVVFDANGVAYYTLQVDSFGRGYGPDALLGAGQPFAGNLIVLARSQDGGSTWDKLVTYHAGDGTVAYQDYMRMAVNPKTGTVYTIWNQVDVVASFPVLVATDDGGETARPPVYIPGPAPEGTTGAGESGIVADKRDGTVYVLLGGPNSGGAVYLTTSTDDARSFATPVEVFRVNQIPGKLANTQFRANTFVELAIDNSDGANAGALYAVWAEWADGHADVLFSHSHDKGKTWSKPAPVNANATKGDRFMPRVTVDEFGAIHVLYMTREYDPGNKLVDAEYASSVDGHNWTIQRLTTVSSDGDKGVHQDRFPFFGDYVGVSSAGGKTYLAFPHCGTGVCEIGVVKVERQVS